MEASVAEEAARAWLCQRSPDLDFVVIRVEDAGDAWRVFYNSRAYVETGSFSDALFGNIPIRVPKTGTALSYDLDWWREFNG